jgi:hypothetical protein
VLLEVLQHSAARCFKVAPSIEGLVRPDKLIAYFRDHDDLTAVAGELAVGLRGMPAQGVPFTGCPIGCGIGSVKDATAPAIVGSSRRSTACVAAPI